MPIAREVEKSGEFPIQKLLVTSIVDGQLNSGIYNDAIYPSFIFSLGLCVYHGEWKVFFF